MTAATTPPACCRHGMVVCGCMPCRKADCLKCQRAGVATGGGNAPDTLWPCGCLRNDGGAHRGGCPDYVTIRPYDGCNRLDELTWRPRTKETPR